MLYIKRFESKERSECVCRERERERLESTHLANSPWSSMRKYKVCERFMFRLQVSLELHHGVHSLARYSIRHDNTVSN